MRVIGLATIFPLGLTIAPLAAEAQQRGKVYRIGVIFTAMSAASLDAFRQRLRELGYVEGQNIAIEVRYTEAQPERLRRQAAELVGLGVDVIVASNTLATRAAKEKTAPSRLLWSPSATPWGPGS